MTQQARDFSDDGLRRRLAWGCRRGMLELDVILAELACRIKSMPKPELACASKLLEKRDDELYELLVLQSKEPEKELRALVSSCITARRSN